MYKHLYSLALSTPWQMESLALEAMLSFLTDEPMDTEEVARRMHGPLSLALRNGKRRSDGERLSMRGDVAVIAIDGPIYRYADIFTNASGGVTTAALAHDFQVAQDDPGVRAIAFVIDSPGGEVTGLNELANAIFAARGRKPMGAYVEGFGASAAYRILSSAGPVAVDADALVGSIGTVWAVADPTKRPSYRIEFVSRQSPKKRADPTTEEGRAIIQQMVDDQNEVFIAQAARNRGISDERIRATEGALFVGQQAIDAGLADTLGSEEQVIADLAARAVERSTYFMPSRMPDMAPRHQEDDRMKISDIFGGFLRAAKQEGIPIEADEAPTPPAEPAQAQPTTTTGPAPHQPDPKLQARLDELEAQLGEQQRQARQVAAMTFADTAVRNRQALPAEHAALLAAYVQAAEDDADRPVQAGAETRVTRLEAIVSARTPHNLTSELVSVGQGGALLQAGTPQPMTEARREQLLRATPSGQAVLDKRRRGRGA